MYVVPSFVECSHSSITNSLSGMRDVSDAAFCDPNGLLAQGLMEEAMATPQDFLYSSPVESQLLKVLLLVGCPSLKSKAGQTRIGKEGWRGPFK